MYSSCKGVYDSVICLISFWMALATSTPAIRTATYCVESARCLPPKEMYTVSYPAGMIYLNPNRVSPSAHNRLSPPSKYQLFEFSNEDAVLVAYAFHREIDNLSVKSYTIPNSTGALTRGTTAKANPGKQAQLLCKTFPCGPTLLL